MAAGARAWDTGMDWRGSAPTSPLPAEIYVSLVKCPLQRRSTSLVVGPSPPSCTALIAAYKSGEPLLYLCSLLIARVACARGLDVRRYQNLLRRPSSVSSKPVTRERRYVACAAAHVMLLGMWCLVAFSKTADTLCANLQLTRRRLPT